MNESSKVPPAFTPADIGALAHLYRGEVYRSTVWRTRLDATTNWSVVATGIALSVSFSTAEASPSESRILPRRRHRWPWSICIRTPALPLT